MTMKVRSFLEIIVEHWEHSQVCGSAETECWYFLCLFASVDIFVTCPFVGVTEACVVCS